jgi:hypothetical protein
MKNVVADPELSILAAGPKEIPEGVDRLHLIILVCVEDDFVLGEDPDC